MDLAQWAYLSTGILKAKILEWVATPFSRGSFQPRDQTHVSFSSWMEGEFFTTEPPEAPSNYKGMKRLYHQIV